MECRAVPKLPNGEQWVYEVKQDGYRRPFEAGLAASAASIGRPVRTEAKDAILAYGGVG
jgi:hypothetical protein